SNIELKAEALLAAPGLIDAVFPVHVLAETKDGGAIAEASVHLDGLGFHEGRLEELASLLHENASAVVALVESEWFARLALQVDLYNYMFRHTLDSEQANELLKQA
ncbi:MAG: hypothetical protein ACR2OH_10385, partial [Microthrixaceae bacterium]